MFCRRAKETNIIDVEGVKLDEELKMKVCLVEGREKK
jgi:hypothetical protein